MTTSPKRPPLPVLTSSRFLAAADVVVYHEISAEIQNRGLSSRRECKPMRRLPYVTAIRDFLPAEFRP